MVGLGLLVPNSLNMPSPLKLPQLRGSSALISVTLLTMGIEGGNGCGLAGEYDDVLNLDSFCETGSFAAAIEAKREKVREFNPNIANI